MKFSSSISGPKILIPESYLGYFELLSEDGRSTRCIENVLDLSRKPNFRVLVRETFRCNLLNRTIHAGEILTTMYENGKYLKCKTLKEEIINLPLEAKAKFSPIAKEDSISGVHTVKNLLKKRMPVVVRWVRVAQPYSGESNALKFWIFCPQISTWYGTERLKTTICARAPFARLRWGWPSVCAATAKRHRSRGRSNQCQN